MATKPVTVLPAAAAAAGCTATCESYASGTWTDVPTGAVFDWTNFQAVAATVGGWDFDRFRLYKQTTDSDGNVLPPYKDREYASTPMPSDRETSDSEPSWCGDMVQTNPEDARYWVRQDIILYVEAVFRRIPTNLLVNSFNREPRVRLVYDPDTNLLVGDY